MSSLVIVVIIKRWEVEVFRRTEILRGLEKSLMIRGKVLYLLIQSGAMPLPGNI